MPRRKASRPGGASLHNCMSGHGPDAATYAEGARADTSQPVQLADTMAFMFETRSVIRPTRFALEAPQLQKDYARVWRDLPKHFTPDWVAPAAGAGRRNAHRGAARNRGLNGVNATHDPALAQLGGLGQCAATGLPDPEPAVRGVPARGEP